MSATPGALLLLGGVGLIYWSVYSNKGLLGKDRIAPISYIPYDDYAQRHPSPDIPNVSASQQAFMRALVKIESGGSYTAYNRKCLARRAANGLPIPTWGSGGNVSGCAYGKYQFMPKTWEDWSRRWYGRVVTPTPAAQEYVANKQIAWYFEQFKDWRLVAAAWRNGAGYVSKTPVSQWSTGLKRYVANVMAAING